MFRLLSIFILLSSLLNASPVYVYKQNDGTIKFSNRKPPKSVQAKIYTGFENKVNYSRYKGISSSPYYSGASYKIGKLSTKKYHDEIFSAARRHGVSGGLVKAVIHAESGFNPRAISPKGARGLMQLMPENLRRFGVRDAFSPEQNIEGGTKLLSRLIRKYRGDLKLALAAYNAGEMAVARYRGIPPYQETQDYVRKVLNLYTRYQTLA